jgi:hypothetical protein
MFLRVCKIIVFKVSSQWCHNWVFKIRKMTFLYDNWKSKSPNSNRRVRVRLHPNLRCKWGKKVLECVQTLKIKLSSMKQCDELSSLWTYLQWYIFIFEIFNGMIHFFIPTCRRPSPPPPPRRTPKPFSRIPASPPRHHPSIPHLIPPPARHPHYALSPSLARLVSPMAHCDNPPRKIPYYRINQSTLV